jgi:hypothetical protein
VCLDGRCGREFVVLARRIRCGSRRLASASVEVEGRAGLCCFCDAVYCAWRVGGMGSSTKVRESFDAASVGPVRWWPISVLVHRAAYSLLLLERRA